MKVGTDGCLLGAWAECGVCGDNSSKILDVGTGTGLISLMLAQRFSTAAITAIDIDGGAVAQALQNVAASPFAGRIDVRQCAVQDFSGRFDAIVSNPPYFTDALLCPDNRRTIARHATSLTYRDLMHSAYRLLADSGEMSVIIPADCHGRMEGEAAIAGFHLHRSCAVFTSAGKPAKRYLLSFTKKQMPTLSTVLHIGGDEFRHLLKDFYLKL